MPSLKDELAAALSAGFNPKIRYISSPSKKCDPLFSALPGQEVTKTRLASHFLTMSVDSSSTSSKDVSLGSKDVISFAIEVLIYTTRHLTTIFVSKVDSTSYIPRQRPSPIKTTVTTFLRWLADKERRKRPSRKVVLSLFARAQSAYLFPGSADDKSKHVLDDRQLIKWWARVLDPIIPRTSIPPAIEDTEISYQGYITVPGYAGNELKRSFMPRSSDSADAKNRWLAGHPLVELAQTRGVPEHAPPRCFLPRFPDDPKSRFIQDLDDEIGLSEDSQVQTSPSKKGKNGMWNSVRDLDRFWEAMEFRQECSSGRVVGFLWLVISPRQSDIEIPDADSSSAAANIDGQDPLTTDMSQSSISTSHPANTGSPKKRKRKPLTGLIVPRMPRLKGGSSSLSGLSDLVNAENPGDGVAISEEGYDKVMQTMLHLDFSTLQAAIRSTNRWIAEVASVCGLNGDFGVEVTGISTAPAEIDPAVATLNGNTAEGVNDLGGMVRKKRKVQEGQSQPIVEDRPAVNTLGGGLIRKKAKPKADA